MLINSIFKYPAFQLVQCAIASKKGNKTPIDVSALIENSRASLSTCGDGQTLSGPVPSKRLTVIYWSPAAVTMSCPTRCLLATCGSDRHAFGMKLCYLIWCRNFEFRFPGTWPRTVTQLPFTFSIRTLAISSRECQQGIKAIWFFIILKL